LAVQGLQSYPISDFQLPICDLKGQRPDEQLGIAKSKIANWKSTMQIWDLQSDIFGCLLRSAYCPLLGHYGQAKPHVPLREIAAGSVPGLPFWGHAGRRITVCERRKP